MEGEGLYTTIQGSFALLQGGGFGWCSSIYPVGVVRDLRFMGVFPNENATARHFWETHQQGKCSRVGESQVQKQIPFGNDRKKGKGKGKSQYGGPSLRSRMTAKNKQRQRQEQLQEPIRGSFASLKDDGEKQATAKATATAKARATARAPATAAARAAYSRMEKVKILPVPAMPWMFAEPGGRIPYSPFSMSTGMVKV
jgi:hypothetical protein